MTMSMLPFQWFLASNPAAGDVIPKSSGLRKVRWRGKGKGKRGGLRVIYYYYSSDDELWLLTLYAKNEATNIPANTLKLLKEELKNE